LQPRAGQDGRDADQVSENGAQPLTNADQSVAAIVNGEIYNHRELRKSFEGLYEFQTNSDSEVIIPLVG
jgi:asparagine synthase (glutamine-hydrolysing)